MSERQPLSEKERAIEGLVSQREHLLSGRYGPSYSNLLWQAKKAERPDLIPQIVKVGALQGLENAILAVSAYIERQEWIKEVLSHDFGYAMNVAKEFDPEIGDVLRELYQTGKYLGEPNEANYPEILERLQALKAKHGLDLSAEFIVLRDMLEADVEEIESMEARADESPWRHRAR